MVDRGGVEDVHAPADREYHRYREENWKGPVQLPRKAPELLDYIGGWWIVVDIDY